MDLNEKTKAAADLARMLENRLAEQERIIRLICARNERVELDKAWEQSTTRKLAIALLTYFLTCIVFWSIGVTEFALNAFIPTIGYLLSTQSLPAVRRIWAARIRAQGKDETPAECG